MNTSDDEFAWLRQTRALNRASAPQRDLWAGIAKAIGNAAPARRMHPAWSAAAALVLALGGLISLYTGMHGRPATMQAQAGERWRPADPRLAAAAIGLDAAHVELSQALELDPRAEYLQKLMQRTERQRQRLQQLEHAAG
jgi:hypothetical protein